MPGYWFIKNKSAGTGRIPADFIKVCKYPLVETLTAVLNYINEYNEFPNAWAGGFRSAVFKSGKHNTATNFRGITILPLWRKYLKQSSTDG